jgi:tRNA(Ile)-lysidine synthase
LRPRAVAVAFSGGRDSTAMLHATAGAAESLGLSVLALHVHHGLSDRADAWLAHATALCRRWAGRGLPVTLVARRLEGAPGAGESVEAWARRGRYRALREMAVAAGADLVLLGHHRRDQAETFLLQALRGGGLAALSAMPKIVRRDGVTWARPWLEQSREAIEAYARRHRLRWIDDDSNDDDRFARNRLRLRVWPALSAAFEDAEASLARAATHVQQAAAALDEFVARDVAAVAGDNGLDLAAWRLLSPPRQRQVLLRWLRGELAAGAPASLVERLLREADASPAQRRWPFGAGELRSYRGRLQRVPCVRADPEQAPPSLVVDLSRLGTHRVDAWQGAFHVERVDEGGLAGGAAAALELRPRAPGDRFQAGPRRPPRSLKLQFQAGGVAPALRNAPIVCRDGVPVFVPGLGIDARAIARPGEAQISLTWLPD